jgi:hypothetical protein
MTDEQAEAYIKRRAVVEQPTMHPRLRAASPARYSIGMTRSTSGRLDELNLLSVFGLDQ